MNPFFSVIIPLYNKSNYIEKTLKSVLEQSFTDFEIIIVNDGSTDDSVIKAKQFNDSRIKIIHQENSGASVARNKAIALSKGNFIAPLDADDLWKNNHLQALKNCITNHKTAVLYCNNYEIKRSDGFITKAKFNFKYNTETIILDDFFEANSINYIPHSSSVAFKKSDFLNIGAYNTKLRTGQDIDLWIKFGLLGPIAFNPKTTMLYNFFDPDSLANSNYNADRLLLINNYKEAEKTNASLKRYLDIKRYALAIRYKFSKEIGKAKNLINDIDKKNINSKQRLILSCPRIILVKLKQFQNFLISKKIYLSAFK